jgi:hypothetical protein
VYRTICFVGGLGYYIAFPTSCRLVKKRTRLLPLLLCVIVSVCTGAELNETGRGENTCAQVPDKKKNLPVTQGKAKLFFSTTF